VDGMNVYGYARLNPVAGNDPWGLFNQFIPPRHNPFNDPPNQQPRNPWDDGCVGCEVTTSGTAMLEVGLGGLNRWTFMKAWLPCMTQSQKSYVSQVVSQCNAMANSPGALRSPYIMFRCALPWAPSYGTGGGDLLTSCGVLGGTLTIEIDCFGVPCADRLQTFMHEIEHLRQACQEYSFHHAKCSDFVSEFNNSIDNNICKEIAAYCTSPPPNSQAPCDAFRRRQPGHPLAAYGQACNQACGSAIANVYPQLCGNSQNMHPGCNTLALQCQARCVTLMQAGYCQDGRYYGP